MTTTISRLSFLAVALMLLGASCSTSIGLGADDAFFSIDGEDGQPMATASSVFDLNDTVSYTVPRVGAFTPNAEGEYRAEMALTVREGGPSGDIVFQNEALSGGNGLLLPGEAATHLTACWNPGVEAEVGTYYMHVRIYDLYSNSHLTSGETFELR